MPGETDPSGIRTGTQTLTFTVDRAPKYGGVDPYNYLIDRKVSLPEKQRQFVLLSGDEIVWLVGRRIDDRYRLTPDTENVLRITKEIV